MPGPVRGAVDRALSYVEYLLGYLSDFAVQFWPGGDVMEKSPGQASKEALAFVESCGLKGREAERVAKYLEVALREAYRETRTSAELRMRLQDVKGEVLRMVANR